MHRGERLDAVIDAALRLPPAQAQEYVAAQLADDPESCAEALSLLGHRADAESIFDSTISDWIPSLVRHNGHSDGSTVGESAARLGRYVLRERIGGGGMGDVYRAARVDGDFEQALAVKLLRRGLDTDAILARFYRERRVLARLSHPNIAQFIDGGSTEEGRPFLVMEYVDGVSLLEYCSARRLTIEERLELFMTLCEAVDFAHRKLVVHRDLKPGNILVTREGTIKLLDFGIAQVLDAPDDMLTQPGVPSRPFTRPYAAPEQMSGDATGTAVDVYSLGVILCEVVAGFRPGESTRLGPARALRALVARELDRAAAIARERRCDLSRLIRRLEGDLGSIIVTAVHPDPLRRYRSPEALRDDLRRLLGTLPISARTDSWAYRTATFIRRHRWVVAASASILALLLGASIVVTALAFRLSDRSSRLTTALEEVEVREAEVKGEYRRALSAASIYTKMIVGLAHGDESMRERIVGEIRRHSDRLDAPEIPISPAAEISAREALGLVARALGAHDVALQQFLRIIELARDIETERRVLIHALSLCGMTHFETGEYARAIEFLTAMQAALLDDGSLHEADLMLVEALLVQGRREEARAALRRAPLPPAPFDALLRETISRLEQQFDITLSDAMPPAGE